MSRLAATFERLRGRGRKALIPYVTAGDPTPECTVPLMHALVAAGADVIELGVPFSDPMADGPVIQAACERALVHGTNLRRVLGMVREFRCDDANTPVVLMGYLNPVEVMGYAHFASEAAQAGVDGVLTVDLPPEEGAEFVQALRAHELDPIFLLAPTTTPERIGKIAAAGGGFIYYVSIKGVTGTQALEVDAVASKLAQVRTLTKLPIGVGFGIRDGATAARVAQIADAVVVGSALVARVGALADQPVERITSDVAGVVREMREALDAVAVK